MMKLHVNEYTIKRLLPKLYSHYAEVKVSKDAAISLGNFLITKELEKEISDLTFEVVHFTNIIVKVRFKSESMDSILLISNMVNE